jgi:hypothetical protein
MSYGMGSPTGVGTSVSATGSMKEKVPSGYSKGSLQNFSPEQMQLFQSLFGHLQPGSFLSRLAGGDQSLFGEIEAPALRQFNALQGNIASRFSGMGLGGRKSSGFQNTMNAATSNFAQELQSQRQNLQRQAIQDLLGLSGSLLQQKPYEQFLVKKPNVWGDIAGKFAGAIPGALAGFMSGGPMGAGIGAGTSLLGDLDNQFRSGEAYNLYR